MLLESASNPPGTVVVPPPKIADSFNPFWAEIDYLAWTVKGDHPPPLVTASPDGTPLAQAGVLGAPGTTVLFGAGTSAAGVQHLTAAGAGF